VLDVERWAELRREHFVRGVLAQARIIGDPVLLHQSLINLAGSSLAWAELFGSE
jgi:hypothetical protein